MMQLGLSNRPDTTEQAPMTDESATAAPLSTTAFIPTHTWSPTTMSREGLIRLPSRSVRAWLSPVRKWMPPENKQPLPMPIRVSSIAANSVMPCTCVDAPTEIELLSSSHTTLRPRIVQSSPMSIVFVSPETATPAPDREEDPTTMRLPLPPMTMEHESIRASRPNTTVLPSPTIVIEVPLIRCARDQTTRLPAPRVFSRHPKSLLRTGAVAASRERRKSSALAPK